MVGSPGVEPGLPPSRTEWIPVFLEAAAVETAGIEPARRRLRGAPGTMPVIPVRGLPEIRTLTLRNAVAVLCQLELPAQGRRALTRW